MIHFTVLIVMCSLGALLMQGREGGRRGGERFCEENAGGVSVWSRWNRRGMRDSNRRVPGGLVGFIHDGFSDFVVEGLEVAHQGVADFIQGSVLMGRGPLAQRFRPSVRISLRRTSALRLWRQGGGREEALGGAREVGRGKWGR